MKKRLFRTKFRLPNYNSSDPKFNGHTVKFLGCAIGGTLFHFGSKCNCQWLPDYDGLFALVDQFGFVHDWCNRE